MSKKKWAGIGITLTAVALIGSCYACGLLVEEVIKEPEPKEVTILSHHITDEYVRPVVIGEVKNTTGSEIKFVSVEVTFFDDEGVIIGKSSDYIGEISPGETYRFKVYGWELLYTEIDSYEIEASGH